MRPHHAPLPAACLSSLAEDAAGGAELLHVALFGLNERAQPWGRSGHRAHALLSERAMSALCSLRAKPAEPHAVLRRLLHWLACQAELFTAPLAPGRPLLLPDPGVGGVLPQVPERALLAHDELPAERAALAA